MKELVISILKKALKEEKIEIREEEIEKFIEVPPSYDMGDYAFPCFFLAGKLKENPSQIAIKLRERIGTPPLEFEDIQTSGPYINFFIDRKNLAVRVINEILSKKDDFG